MVYLIEQFTPLLKKRASLLACDDAYEDLRCEFIALIMRFPPTETFSNDGAVTNYISKSMDNVYNGLLKKKIRNQGVLFFNQLSDKELASIENINTWEDDYSEIHICSLRSVLTDTEFEVIYRHFVLKLSIVEIAAQDSIKRQTVNITKNRALKKIQNTILTN